MNENQNQDYSVFGGRLLRSSSYWNWIQILPGSVISENIPDPSDFRQAASSRLRTLSTHSRHPDISRILQKISKKLIIILHA